MKSRSGTLFIANEWVKSSGDLREVIDPATEEVVGAFAESTADEVERAVAAATQAQRQWWAMSALDRANALHTVADRMIENSPQTGECLTREMGKPFRESNWEGGAAASSFRYYAEIARSEQGRVAGPAIAGQLQMVILLHLFATTLRLREVSKGEWPDLQSPVNFRWSSRNHLEQ